MRKIKGSGSYLRNQTTKNFAKAGVCLFLFTLTFFVSMLQLFLTFEFDIIIGAGLFFSVIFLIGGYFFLNKYRTYNGGWQGEKKVIKLLKNTLNNDYYLINEVNISKNADVDHIVLGPNGIFVIETKNWSGKITCNSDDWQREDRKKYVNSPSRQVKKNTTKVKQKLEIHPDLRNHGIWVESIVVFTNDNISLYLNKPTVTVLKIAELPKHIINYKNYNPYTINQIEKIAKEIQKIKQKKVKRPIKK